jgi:two-component sensor histidine kinase
MNYTRLIRTATAIGRISLVCGIGSIVLYKSGEWLLEGLNTVYLVLYLPVFLVALFGMVAFTLSETLRLQSWLAADATYRYSRRELLALYGRSYTVVLSVVGMAVLFGLYGEAPRIVTALFYLLDLFLLLYGVGNIVKSEKLRELNIRAIQTENALLKSKLNPHFLYNTLNNIDALIACDADKASEAVIKLSSLLRYITYRSDRRTVPLGEELTHLREYVDLQLLRFDNPAVVRFEASVADPATPVAPMLLMPLIENVFKHATDRRTPDAIRIDLRADSHRLTLATCNSALPPDPTAPPRPDSGMGLKAVERRLRLLYGNRFALSARYDDGMFRCELQIKN